MLANTGASHISWNREDDINRSRILLTHLLAGPSRGTRQSMMNEIAWQLEDSIETDASPGFAWSYLTDVRNWDDPPAQFVLDGPFAAGSQGTTLMPDQEPLQWRIRDVLPVHSYLIETQFERATLSFEWCFDAVSER